MSILFMLCFSQTKIIMLNFENQISYVLMFSSLCPTESVLTAYWKNAKLAKLTKMKSVCPSPIFNCNFSIWKWMENTFLSHLIWWNQRRNQRTNSIWNTNPSNIALNSTQIFNYASTFPQTNCKKVSYLFCLTVLSFFCHYFSIFAAFFAWSNK